LRKGYWYTQNNENKKWEQDDDLPRKRMVFHFERFLRNP
jgi:hypothetical protein